jgi:perosamine synthetase
MEKIPLFRILSDEKDVDSVSSVVRRKMFWAEGPEIEEFERELSEYIGTKYCLVFNSGTSALHAVLSAYDIRDNDEVIVPSFTFIATVNSPLFVGARPVFSDIEDQFLGLDPVDLQKRVTKKTKAIIAVHYAGGPCLINELKGIAEENDLILIEDASEAFGAKISSKMIGTFGDATVLSFCNNKIITTGEGGAVLTDSVEIYEKLKLIRSHGRNDGNYFLSSKSSDYVTMGYNFRMSTMTAALGLSQIKKVGKIIELRREVAQYYNEKLADLEQLSVPKEPHEYFHVYQLFSILLSSRAIRDDLKEYLLRNGVSCKVYFPPAHRATFYKDTLEYSDNLHVTECVSDRILSIPIYPEITLNERERVVSSIRGFFDKGSN